MKRSATLFLVFLTALIAAALSGPAVAGHDDWRRGSGAQHQWAQQYAESSVRQARMARRQGCNFHGNRWNTDYQRHYNWALRTNRYDLRRAIDRRESDLLRCRTRHGYAGNHHYGNQYGNHDRGRSRKNGRDHGRSEYGRGGHHRKARNLSREDFARWYADTATDQANENYRFNCGGRGNIWTTNWTEHYRWALGVRRDQAINGVERRDRHLRQCGSHAYRG